MAGDPIPLPKAAQILGLTPEAVRQRVKRGELEGFRDNRGRWQVVLGESNQQRLATDSANADEIGTLRVEVARWQERADGLGKRLEDRDREIAEIKAELRRQVEQLRADLDHERQRAEEAERRQAERDRQVDEVLRQLSERRPWPGFKAWWRRVWEGEG
jgi:predicted HTH domain antitoxin